MIQTCTKRQLHPTLLSAVCHVLLEIPGKRFSSNIFKHFTGHRTIDYKGYHQSGPKGYGANVVEDLSSAAAKEIYLNMVKIQDYDKRVFFTYKEGHYNRHEQKVTQAYSEKNPSAPIRSRT